jgi:hypothetical protein
VPSVTPPPKNRRQFVRTKITLVERVASVVCLVLLAAIGGYVLWKGKHFDPALYSVRTESLQTTTNEVKGEDGTARTADVRPELGAVTTPKPAVVVAASGVEAAQTPDASAPAEASAEGSAPSGPPIKGDPLEVNLPGTTPMSDTEFYGPNNLFEKIDGRAPAYLTFNFQQLRCRSFSVTGAAGSYVDVYEYRFDTPINAFGMFAIERDTNGKKIDFAPDGYSGELGYYFRQGVVYVQIIASDQNAKTMTLAKALAMDRAKNLKADDAGLDGRRQLPSTGLDPATVQFVQENAQGQEFLKNVFQAVYDYKGKKLPFFTMAAKPEEAAAAFKSFQEFCGKYGGTTKSLPDVNGAKIFSAENFGTYKVVFQRNGQIGGVFDADDIDKGRQFVEEYLRGELQ